MKKELKRKCKRCFVDIKGKKNYCSERCIMKEFKETWNRIKWVLEDLSLGEENDRT